MILLASSGSKMMPTVSFKNIKWCLSEKTSSCWRVQDLVGLAGLPPQQDVDLLLDPILIVGIIGVGGDVRVGPLQVLLCWRVQDLVGLAGLP